MGKTQVALMYKLSSGFKMLQYIILLNLLLLLTVNAHASLEIPPNLTSKDRKEALQTLGLGSISKVLSNPYPLGGNAGIEVGVEANYLNVSNLSRLGSKADTQREFSYYNFTFGKGLYGDVDVMVHFAPFLQKERVSNYGAQVRWMFFQSGSMPASTSLNLHSHSANFSNLINTQSLGFNLIQNITVDDVSLFFGLGQVKCQGSFVGGASGVTDSGLNEQEDLYETHSFFGINIAINEYFIAAQLDRFQESNISFKLGSRF